MKNILPLFLALAAIVMAITTLSGCKKEPITCDKPVDCLPPATQTGARTFGCLVDGEVFLPKEKFGRRPLDIAYQFFTGSYHFGIVATNVELNPVGSVIIGFTGIELEENKTYQLNTTADSNNPYGEYFIGGGSHIHDQC